ncbi:MAG: class I SAM-dependent methyltransferase [Planctomycetaceae bacterium]
MNLLTEYREFYRQFRRRFETTGAIAPSSRFLARAQCSPLLERDGPLRVLEVGPGTGAVTSEIVRRLGADSRLDLVEINEQFAELLRQRFQHDPRFQPAADRSKVHHGPLQEFRPVQPYDVIISGLPFNNFSAELVEELIDRCLALLAPGGELTFFEYMFVRPLRRAVSPAETRRRLGQIEVILQARFARHRIKTDWVFVNVPPAWVQHLRKESDDAPSRQPAAIRGLATQSPTH